MGRKLPRRRWKWLRKPQDDAARGAANAADGKVDFVEEHYPATKGPAFEGQSAIGGAAPVRDPQAAQPLTHMAAGVRHEWLPPRCPPEAGGLSRQDWKTVGTASAEPPRADVHPASPQPPQSTLCGHPHC
jgi:hypothetical protein